MRDTGIEPARGRIFRAREAPINLSLAEGISPRRSLVHTPGTQKIPGPSIRGFHTCARYWDRTSEGKNFPSARGTNKSFPRRGRQPEEVTGSHPPGHKKSPDLPSEDSILVRDTGIEPVTSSVSGKRATAAPIALTKQLFCCEVRTGFEPAYTALQAAA